MRSSALLAVFVSLTALASSSLAQTPATGNGGRIEATVLDAQGLPILGAQVTATLPAGNLRRTATSSTERFTLDGLAPGLYTVRISATGFQISGSQGRPDHAIHPNRGSSIETGRSDRAACGHADAVRESRRRRAGERERAHRRADSTVAGCGCRRCAAADPDVQFVPPNQQHRVASDSAGGVAARSRTERRQPHARAARQRSRSTIRSAAGCTGRGCR